MKYQQLQRNPCKHMWTKEEDQILRQVVGTGELGKWAIIAHQFNLRAKLLNPENSQTTSILRTNKQCQERWQNHVNPALQNNHPWSEQQHCLLFQLFKVYCHQWSKIGQKLVQGGFSRRGGTNIKNYFYSTIKRSIKTINSYIRQHNLNNKKRKSQLYHYAQKYVYKKRLSLERQILEGSSDCGKSNNIKTQSDLPQEEELKIVKELDHNIINKILLLAEWKGDNKFVISRQQDHSYACTLRNSLIDFVQDNNHLNASQAVSLAQKILQISKNCKRKTHRALKGQKGYSSNSGRQKSLKGSIKGEAKKLNRQRSKVQMQYQQGQNYNQEFNEEIMSQSFNQEQILERIMNNQGNKSFQPYQMPALIKPIENINYLNIHINQPNPQQHRFILQQSSELQNISLQHKQPGIPSPIEAQIQLAKGHSGARSPLNFADSLNYQQNQLNKDLQPKEISEELILIDNQDACSRVAQVNFISTFREVTPRDSQINSQALDFDFDYNTQIFVYQDGGQGPSDKQDHSGLLNSNLQLRWNSAKHFRSDRLINRDSQRIEESSIQMFSNQPFRHSWAHTEKHNEGHTFLFSSNYHENKGEQFSAKPKRNNFRPLYRQ